MPGTLRAKAYFDGEVIATHERVTPGDPVGLDVSVDLSERPLESGVNDVVFVYAKVVGAQGHAVYGAEPEVRFTVDGDAEIVGDHPIDAEAGIATILLRAGSSPGDITITAESDGLETGAFTVTAN